MNNRITQLLAAIFMVSAAGSAYAVTYTVSTADHEIAAGQNNLGYYEHTTDRQFQTIGFEYDPGAPYVFAGHTGSMSFHVHSNTFASFYLGDLQGNVLGATLRFINTNIGGQQDVTVFDVGADAQQMKLGNLDKASVFDDLGSGAVYGQKNLGDAPYRSWVEIVLAPEAVQAINATRGFFSVGLVSSWILNSDGPVYLDLTLPAMPVPEPSQYLLLALGLVALAALRRPGHRA